MDIDSPVDGLPSIVYGVNVHEKDGYGSEKPVAGTENEDATLHLDWDRSAVLSGNVDRNSETTSQGFTPISTFDWHDGIQKSNTLGLP